MSFAVAATIGAVGSIGGALISSSAAKSAANAAAKGDAAAIAEQQRQFDLTRQDYAPYRQVGTGALNQLAALYGIPQYTAPAASTSYSGSIPYSGYGGLASSVLGQYLQRQQPTTAANATPNAAPDFSSFYNSPDYNFARTEGMRGLEQSAAARGGAFSGNALKALSQYNQGLASQQYGNYVNRLQSLSGIGQSATQSLGALGGQYSGNIAQLMSDQGATRASGIQAQGNIWGNAIQGLGGLAYGLYQNRAPNYDNQLAGIYNSVYGH